MYLADGRTPPPGAVAPAGRGTRPGRRGGAIPATVLALGTVSLVTDVSSEMVTAVLPLYLVSGLGLSPLGFGLLDGVYNGVGALVRLLGGRLADRGGGRHKAVAAAGYGLSALCKPLLLVAHGLPLIGAVLAADRTGKGLRTAPRDALISLSCEPAARGRAFGAHRAMDTAGALLGPVVAFLVLRVAAGGYDAVFTVSGCVAALGVLVLLLFVPAGPANSPTSTTGPHTPVRALLRRPAVRRLTGCAVLLGLTTVSDSFLYLALQRRLDLSESWFPLLPLGTSGVFLALALPMGVLADRFGRRRLFLCGHLALLAAYALLVTVSGTSPVLAGAVLALHGGFYAATDGVLAAATADAVPKEARGSGLAVVQTGQAAARFACSVAFGAAWTAWGDRTALGAAAAGLAVSALAGAVLLRRGSPPGKAR
ncbi:MFS transporter [Streptomyces sp. AV19]|uniref:MFS transporter n=1 Tax=Streptomyces sp. AV19 TaxID=2793068 RepID=UPI0018FE2598|nr:MFS transporter [Streptomyces sp. AV19]MBH1937236.1 MFS transporter [Streptomyces sp. AV19]MDG4536712.1 MFS transporter [Streptomyces sp. AV19]